MGRVLKVGGPVRWLAAMVIVLATACSSTSSQEATPSASGSGGATSTTGLLKSYQSKDLSFRYPANWYESHDAPGRRTPGGYEPIVYLSSQRLGPDCVTAPPTTTCGVKVALGGPLHPGDIVVFWLGFGGPGYQTPETTNQTIAGFPAQVDRDAPNPVCEGLGADHSLVANIRRGSARYPTGTLGLTACWRLPDDGSRQRQVQALLGSARIVASP